MFSFILHFLNVLNLQRIDARALRIERRANSERMLQKLRKNQIISRVSDVIFFSRFFIFFVVRAFFFLFIQIIRNLILLLFSFNSVDATTMKREIKIHDFHHGRWKCTVIFRFFCSSSSFFFLFILFRKNVYVFQLKQ